MGLFKRKSVRCASGEWTRIIYDFGKGLPEDMQVTVESSSGEVVEGEYKETHYNWIFPKKPVLGRIEPSMLFHRRWIDGIYTVYFKPNKECVVHFS